MFNGFWLALGYVLAGIVLCILIITIPFGLQAFKLAGFALWPFGREVVRSPDAFPGGGIGNVIWLVLAGWWIAIGHLIAAIGNLALCIFIITIPICVPFAWANLKFALLALWPFGRDIVPIGDRPVPADALVVPEPGR